MTDNKDIFSQDHLTIIRPSRGWQSFKVKELWAYRGLLAVFTWRDIKLRYRQTVLGFAWAIVPPLMMVLVFSIVFGRIADVPSGDAPYPIFVFSALIPWTFFSNSLTGASNSMIGAVGLVQKIYFPRLIVPLAAVGAWLIDLLVASVILASMMVYYDINFSLTLLILPLAILGISLLAVGLGTALAAASVSYRDFRYAVPFFLQFWLFITPVLYAPSFLPERFQWILDVNPMTGFIQTFRAGIFGLNFDVGSLSMSFAAALVVLLLSVAYFERAEQSFADVI